MGGSDVINLFISVEQKKFGAVVDKTELLRIAGKDLMDKLDTLPFFTKEFFFEDYYCYRYIYGEKTGYGIGKDPDKNLYFEPYEE